MAKIIVKIQCSLAPHCLKTETYVSPQGLTKNDYIPATSLTELLVLYISKHPTNCSAKCAKIKSA